MVVARGRRGAPRVQPRCRHVRRRPPSRHRRRRSRRLARASARVRNRLVRRLASDPWPWRDDSHGRRLRRHARPPRGDRRREGRHGRRRRPGRDHGVERHARARRACRPPRDPAGRRRPGIRGPARAASRAICPTVSAGRRPESGAGNSPGGPARRRGSTGTARAARSSDGAGSTAGGVAVVSRLADGLVRPGGRHDHPSRRGRARCSDRAGGRCRRRSARRPGSGIAVTPDTSGDAAVAVGRDRAASRSRVGGRPSAPAVPRCASGRDGRSPIGLEQGWPGAGRARERPRPRGHDDRRLLDGGGSDRWRHRPRGGPARGRRASGCARAPSRRSDRCRVVRRRLRRPRVGPALWPRGPALQQVGSRSVGPSALRAGAVGRRAARVVPRALGGERGRRPAAVVAARGVRPRWVPRGRGDVECRP